jgi:hypothetical protein
VEKKMKSLASVKEVLQVSKGTGEFFEEKQKFSFAECSDIKIDI